MDTASKSADCRARPMLATLKPSEHRSAEFANQPTYASYTAVSSPSKVHLAQNGNNFSVFTHRVLYSPQLEVGIVQLLVNVPQELKVEGVCREVHHPFCGNPTEPWQGRPLSSVRLAAALGLLTTVDAAYPAI